MIALLLMCCLLEANGSPMSRASIDDLVVDEECYMDCEYDYRDDPVCGTDGQTYPNDCGLSCSDSTVKIAHEGECKADGSPLPSASMDDHDEECSIDDILCPRVYEPVCGTDGQTYGNACELRVARECSGDPTIEKAYQGECKDEGSPMQGASMDDLDEECSWDCPFDVDPVCGTDGKTYEHNCGLALARCHDPTIEKAYKGKCKIDGSPMTSASMDDHDEECSIDDMLCPEVYEPVCGTDGQTYGNGCDLRVARCRSDPTIKKAYDGECKAHGSPMQSASMDDLDEECGGVCEYDVDPVCGTDGKTYPNACDLETETAIYNPTLKIAYEGECKGDPVGSGEGGEEVGNCSYGDCW